MPSFPGVTDATRDQWGVMWEAATSAVLLQAGAELLVMRHPKAVEYVRKTIDRLSHVSSD
jgi:acetyl-CoA decarbonylase/synthase complex subunit delta